MPSRMFTDEIQGAVPNGLWMNYYTTCKQEVVFGKKGCVQVVFENAGKTFHHLTFPKSNGGGYFPFSGTLQQEIGNKAGDCVGTTLMQDILIRELEPPSDQLDAKSQKSSAFAHRNTLTYSHKKVYELWINEAKLPETRHRLIQNAVGNLTSGKSFK